MSRTEPFGIFSRHGLVLVPCDRAAREQIAAMKEGERGAFIRRKPRSMAQHRKYFAVLNNVVEATGEWTSTEDLRFEIFKQLKRGLLRVSQVDGSLDFIPDSMAVASMPRLEFERLYEDTMKWLTERYGCDPEMLTQEAA